MTTVVSSNISRLGYNEETSEMLVEFKNGTQYKYWPVHFNDYQDLVNAPSVGRAFAADFKNNSSYEYERI